MTTTARTSPPPTRPDPDGRVLVVGLTGGIGSGKSTVAARLAEHGAEVVDADAVARAVVAPGQPALGEIADRFGPEILAEDGGLDRDALAAVVFADEQARQDLEEITHGRIRSRIAERLDALAAGEAGGEERIVVVDHPLLVETGGAADYPVVVVVTAPAAVRLERLVEQRGMDPEDARARLASQATDVQRRAVATHVIDNDGDREALAAQVDDLWERLTARVERAGA